MKTMETIMKRKSIRKYTNQEITKKDLLSILKAGQAGPSAQNKRDWQFLVIQDKETLKKMAGFLGVFISSPLLDAKMAILVLGDANLSVGNFWQVDCTIAAQNMVLAAHELGIGTCFIGTFPNEKKMNHQRKLFDLPKYIIPHTIITFGYPLEKDKQVFSEFKKDKPLLEEKKVHYEKW